jgi:translation initiation factor eIF-2B subunit beta
MSRVDKVMISAHGIMANGGLVGATGALMIAHAAKAHQVPVFVLGALYKFTPLHPIDSLTFNEFLAPEKIFRLEEDDV